MIESVEENLKQDIELLKKVLPSWQPLESSQIKFQRLPGLSNLIWKVYNTESAIQPQTVIFRRFGDVDSVVDRQRENYVFQELGNKGVGPKCYGVTGKVRIEEWYEARTLDPQDINRKIMRRRIAREISKLHQVELDKLDKKPIIIQVLEGILMKAFEEKVQRKELFTERELKTIVEIRSLFQEEEIKFLKDILPTSPESVVFSHNDLHSQNILQFENSDRLIMIDYEYSAYNFRGYDLANIFNESSIDYNHSEPPFYLLDQKKFPNKKDMVEFVSYYILFFKFGSDEQLDAKRAIEEDSYLDTFIKENYDYSEFQEEVACLVEEMRVCAMLSHYYWIIWSVIMSKNPSINFDYIQYAYDRFQAYLSLKRNFLEQKKNKKKQEITKQVRPLLQIGRLA